MSGEYIDATNIKQIKPDAKKGDKVGPTKLSYSGIPKEDWNRIFGGNSRQINFVDAQGKAKLTKWPGS